MPHDLLSIRDEVREALAAGRPVVALESTIITHGMPFPDNLAMARGVERIVRDAGAVPATIAMLDGRPVVGVAGDALERLAETGLQAAKASARDLGALMVAGATAGSRSVAP